MDDWDEARTLVNDISKARGVGSDQTAPRAKLDILIAQRLIDQMRQSTIVIVPALADLGSEIKKHREALQAASRSSTTIGLAIVALTVVLALTAVVNLFAK